MREPFIKIRGLKKTFLQNAQPLTALEDVDMDVFAKEFVCILGPSGCGKSTLLNILARLDSQYEGDVEVRGLRLKEAKNVSAQ